MVVTTTLGGGGGSHGDARGPASGPGAQDGYAVIKEPEVSKPTGVWRITEVYQYVKDGEWT